MMTSSRRQQRQKQGHGQKQPCSAAVVGSAAGTGQVMAMRKENVGSGQRSGGAQEQQGQARLQRTQAAATQGFKGAVSLDVLSSVQLKRTKASTSTSNTNNADNNSTSSTREHQQPRPCSPIDHGRGRGGVSDGARAAAPRRTAGATTDAPAVKRPLLNAHSEHRRSSSSSRAMSDNMGRRRRREARHGWADRGDGKAAHAKQRGVASIHRRADHSDHGGGGAGGGGGGGGGRRRHGERNTTTTTTTTTAAAAAAAAAATTTTSNAAMGRLL